jgi:O-antigen/teichoic acid export membrane protein
MSHKKDFIKDALVYGLGNGIKKFIGFFLLPFYTRALTPEDYGLLSTLSTFTMLLSALLNIGLDSASGYYFFQAKDQDEKGKVLFTHFILRLFGIIPPLILSFFSAPISRIFFKTEDYAWLVFISIMLVPVNLLMSEQSHIYRYFRKPWSYNITTIVKSLVNIGVGISLVVILKWGVIGAQLASIISSSVVVVGSLLLYTGSKYTWKFSGIWAKKMLGFGFPLIWAGLATWVFNSIDRFFLLHYKDLTEIGYYSVGINLSQPILLINTAVQMSFGVLFFKIYNEEKDIEKPESKKMAIDSLNLYLCGAVLIAVLISIFGVGLVNTIATKDYSPAVLAIPLISFSLIAGQAYQLMGPGIALAEKNWHYTWITILTALINIILNFLLIPTWGFVGASASTLISFICFWLIKQWISHRYFKIQYPYLKILSLFLTGLCLAVLFPFMEFYQNIRIPLFYKISSIFFLAFIAFATRMLSLRSLSIILSRQKK